MDKSGLLDKGYIAAKSGHSRGCTVDLTIVDMMTGRELDMGGGFDCFGELSHPDYTETLTQEQIYNRMIFREAIVNNGFRSLPEEWCHFTLENEIGSLLTLFVLDWSCIPEVRLLHEGCKIKIMKSVKKAAIFQNHPYKEVQYLLIEKSSAVGRFT